MAARWISLAQARELVPGHVEWWKIPGPGGRTVTVPKDDGSNDNSNNPVCLFGSGWAYLGEWNHRRDERQGYGVLCHIRTGKITIGTYKSGRFLDRGLPFLDFWLPHSLVWSRNVWHGSPIVCTETGIGLPFLLCSSSLQQQTKKTMMTAILKDGITGTGPWAEGEPVGDWWEEHCCEENHHLRTAEDLVRILKLC